MKHNLSKTDAQLEQKLKQSLHRPSPVTNDTHRNDTILLVREEACRKQGRRRISFARYLLLQIRFMGWKIWMIQGIFLLLTVTLLSRFYRYHVTVQHTVKLLVCLSVLVFMTALPFLYRSISCRMQEIEAASRFSYAKLLLAKLIVVGIGDISLLACIFLTTVIKAGLPAGSAVFYVCFPFLLSGSGCLYMLGHFAPRHFFSGSLIFCSLLVLAFGVIPGQYTVLFQQSLSAVWIMICALLFSFCAKQLCHIMDSAFFEELQII